VAILIFNEFVAGLATGYACKMRLFAADPGGLGVIRSV